MLFGRHIVQFLFSTLPLPRRLAPAASPRPCRVASPLPRRLAPAASPRPCRVASPLPRRFYSL